MNNITIIVLLVLFFTVIYFATSPIKKLKSQKVYFYWEGKRYRNIHPENRKIEVSKLKTKRFIKNWSLGLIAVVVIVSGTWLHFRANADYCGLTAVQCLLEE